MIVEMQVVSFVQALMVRRITENSNLSFTALPDKTFKFKGDKMTAANATIRPAEFWRQYRANDPMSESEERMQEIMGQVGQVKGFRGILWVAKAFIENFVETTTDPKKGSKFDVAPSIPPSPTTLSTASASVPAARLRRTLNPHPLLPRLRGLWFQRPPRERTGRGYVFVSAQGLFATRVPGQQSDVHVQQRCDGAFRPLSADG